MAIGTHLLRHKRAPRTALLWAIAIAAVALAALGGRAISAQDKYTVQVPGGLAFSEFRGYEDWQTVAVSGQSDRRRARSHPRQSYDD
jgi:hypothetical protein